MLAEGETQRWRSTIGFVKKAQKENRPHNTELKMNANLNVSSLRQLASYLPPCLLEQARGGELGEGLQGWQVHAVCASPRWF